MYRLFIDWLTLRILYTSWLYTFFSLPFTKALAICLIKVYTCKKIPYRVLTWYNILCNETAFISHISVTKKSPVIVQTIHSHLIQKKYFSDGHNQHPNQGDLNTIPGVVSSKFAKTYSGTKWQRLWCKHGCQYFYQKRICLDNGRLVATVQHMFVVAPMI